jgi:hypothetical protein
MNEHEPMERSGRYVVAVIPERLIAPNSVDRYPRSSRIDDVERFMEESSSWQAVGFSARDNATFAAMSGGTEFRRMHELGGLIADTGEQLGLVHAARVEGELWRDVIEDTEPPRDLREHGQLIGYRMAHRTFLELQTLYVMSIGHRLANVAARFLALNLHLRALLAQTLRNQPTFEPDSNNRHDWLSLHATVASKLKEVADESQMSAVAALIEPIDTYAASSAWKEFADRRGIHFHRWRPQTAGIAGVSQTPPVVTPPGGGFHVSLGTPAPYHDADTLNDELDDLVKAALLGAIDAMSKFRAGFRAAVAALVSDRLDLGF